MNEGSITDMNANVLVPTVIIAPLFKFIYISPSAKAAAESSGQVSLYAMLPSIGVSLLLSLLL